MHLTSHKYRFALVFILIGIVIFAITNAQPLNTEPVDFKSAITGLCKEYNWVAKKNFTACKTFARKKGILKDFGKLKSADTVDSAQYSLLAERAAQLKPAQLRGSAEAPISAAGNEKPPAAALFVKQNFTPVTDTLIAENTFAGVALAESVPSRFYRDEVYFVNGVLTGDQAGKTEAFVFLCGESSDCKNSRNILGDVTDGRFSIPVHFDECGNFSIGIIPGRSGQSRIEDISVLCEDPPREAGAAVSAPAKLPLKPIQKYARGRTIFSLPGAARGFVRLVIFQNNLRRDYLFRQKQIREFAPDSKDFKNFRAGEAGWLVEQDETASPVQSINLVTQEFHKIDANAVQIKTLPEIFAAPGHFIFSAKALAAVSHKGAFTLPQGNVTEFKFSEQDAAPGDNLRLEADLNSEGIYIFEINNPLGAAIINVPVYVGDVTPLLPDIFALTEETPDKTTVKDLKKARREFLKMINSDRKAHGLSAVSLNEELNSIAQQHSVDMVKRAYFSHVNPDGLNPDARRRKAKYPAGIRENLGKAAVITLVEAGLMRSPIHRAAILDPNMTRVGLGIEKDSEGYFITTQNFSSDPLTEEEKPAFKEKIINTLNNFRASQNIKALAPDALLEKTAKEWSDTMVKEKFFGTASPDGHDSLVAHSRTNGIQTRLQATVMQSSDQNNIIEVLKQNEASTNAAHSRIGIGISINGGGEIHVTAIFTQ